MAESITFTINHDVEPMDAASEAARASFKVLWRELSWEYRRIIKALQYSAVKFPFEAVMASGDTEIEHMWVSEIYFDGEMIEGRLVNQPNHIPDLKEGDPIQRPWREMSDWIYLMDDIAYGAFTVQVIRASMGGKELKDHDDAWGVDFGDPSIVRLTPYGDDTPSQADQRPKKKGLFGGWFSAKSAPPAPPETLIGGWEDLSEHPMSENSAESIEGQVASHPALATELDDDGWSILQREALAGNLAPVKALLRHGADPFATNPSGNSAMDLAQLMSWPKVIEVFKEQAN